MKKMPCLFVREFHDKGRFTLTEAVTPGCEWVLAGEGVATRKWDGTACMVKDGALYKRYDAKRDPRTNVYRLPPTGAIACDEPDPVTGHWPHWIPVGDEPESKWHQLAWKTLAEPLPDGTYELCGPQVNGNPEGLERLDFFRHGLVSYVSQHVRSFASIRQFLSEVRIEGIVFHHDDGRMCKIRRHDFGFSWGRALH